MQRCGIPEVRNALENENVSMLLVLRDSNNPEIEELTEFASKKGIPVIQGSESDIWRMSKFQENDKLSHILALVGRNPNDSPALSIFANVFFTSPGCIGKYSFMAFFPADASIAFIKFSRVTG